MEFALAAGWEWLGLVGFFVVVPLLVVYLVREKRRRDGRVAEGLPDVSEDADHLHRAIPPDLLRGGVLAFFAVMLLSAALFINTSEPIVKRSWALFGGFLAFMAIWSFWRYRSKPGGRRRVAGEPQPRFEPPPGLRRTALTGFGVGCFLAAIGGALFGGWGAVIGLCVGLGPFWVLILLRASS